ncbi:putative CcmH/CycL/Ccl2/NrfF family protein [Helianthus annuus]|nr:putative CcmH/CycL/Ccl2/NrfF family protein [Helianthus annuus]
MENEEDPVKKQQIVDARARNISHNVRCLECGSQSSEESQADIVVLLRKLIRDEIKSRKNNKDEHGETILYAPKFDWQTAA